GRLGDGAGSFPETWKERFEPVACLHNVDVARMHGGKCDGQLFSYRAETACLCAKVRQALPVELEPDVSFGRDIHYEIVEISAGGVARGLHPRERTVQHEGKIRTGGTDISGHEEVRDKLAYKSIPIEFQRIGKDMAGLVESYRFGSQIRIE